MIFLQWVLFYAVPAAAAVYVKNGQSSAKSRVLVLHAGILFSIGLLSIIGVRLTWQASLLSIAAIVGSALVSFLLLHKHGLLYLLSALIQEVCILLAASYLASGNGIIVATIATSLVFAFAHQMVERDVLWKLPIIFFWGCASFALYVWLGDPLLNIAIHATGGSMLIYKRILYTNR